MEMFKRFEPFALLLMVLGALNWGVVGIFNENVLAEILGTGTLTDIVYVVIGISAVVYLPRVMHDLHIGGDHPHPRGV